MADLLDALAFGLRVIEATCPACGRTRGDDCRCSHYCHECDCWTNHTTSMHRAAEADGRKEP